MDIETTRERVEQNLNRALKGAQLGPDLLTSIKSAISTSFEVDGYVVRDINCSIYGRHGEDVTIECRVSLFPQDLVQINIEKVIS